MRINEVAKLTGISKRTLRYYEEIGLLTPNKDEINAYREYSNDDLDRLQQILFYKKLNFSLNDIKKILMDESFNLLKSLKEQRKLIENQIEQYKNLIQLIDHTIQSKEENRPMTNEEKFANLKEQWVSKNEKLFGEELRDKYGENEILASYGKLREMTEEQYVAVKDLEENLLERLRELLEQSIDSEDLMLEVAELHKRWLNFYWAKYSTKAHYGLSQMYLIDERFIEYYDSKAGRGATALLVKCIELYTK